MANLLSNLGSIYSAAGKVKLSAAPVKIMTSLESNLDWSQFNIFKKSITDSTIITFSNDLEGVSILFVAVNSTLTSKLITLPEGLKWAGGAPITSISANTSIMFSLIKIDGDIYCSAVDSMA